MDVGLFTAALGLSGLWRVTRTEFDAEAAQLDLYLGFDRGARFACPAKTVRTVTVVHDTVERTWRHLDFFQHRALLHARLPRVRCPEHGVESSLIYSRRAVRRSPRPTREAIRFIGECAAIIVEVTGGVIASIKEFLFGAAEAVANAIADFMRNVT
jgi:transposase